MHIIEPLYAGDVSIDSDYENGEVTHLVYELDESWNGDLLVAGTDTFAVGGELLDLFKSGIFKGSALKDMEIRYEGNKPIPDFMQLVPDETLKITRGEYDPKSNNDIYLTGSVGELAVSDTLFEKIASYMDKRTFKSREIFAKSEKNVSEKFKYEYVIVTPRSTPFDLVPQEMRKASRRKNGAYVVKGISDKVYISAPYLECLKQFDIDKYKYMDIFEPYFLMVSGNEKESVLSVIKELGPQSFFVGNFDTGFVRSDAFPDKEV